MDSRRSEKGFTLIEVIMVVAIIGILAAISSPYVADWIRNARYKEAGSEIFGILREARSRAVSKNLEHKVEFDIDQDRYRLMEGNRTFNTQSADFTVLYGGYLDVPDGVGLKSAVACNSDDDTSFHFYPNGSSETEPNTLDGRKVCIVDGSGSQKFTVELTSTATGRVVLE